MLRSPWISSFWFQWNYSVVCAKFRGVILVAFPFFRCCVEITINKNRMVLEKSIWSWKVFEKLMILCLLFSVWTCINLTEVIHDMIWFKWITRKKNFIKRHLSITVWLEMLYHHQTMVVRFLDLDKFFNEFFAFCRCTCAPSQDLSYCYSKMW